MATIHRGGVSATVTMVLLLAVSVVVPLLLAAPVPQQCHNNHSTTTCDGGTADADGGSVLLVHNTFANPHVPVHRRLVDMVRFLTRHNNNSVTVLTTQGCFSSPYVTQYTRCLLYTSDAADE